MATASRHSVVELEARKAFVHETRRMLTRLKLAEYSRDKTEEARILKTAMREFDVIWRQAYGDLRKHLEA